MPERVKNRVRNRSGFQLGFVMISGSFWESFWEPKSFKNRYGFRVFFWRVQGGALGKKPRISTIQLAGRGVPGKGRIGVKPSSKGMWFVGLKKDGCRIEKGLWIVD